jgi:hypothetical protein
MARRRSPLLVAFALLAAVALAGCVANGGGTTEDSSVAELRALSDIELSALAAAELEDMAEDVTSTVAAPIVSFDFTETLDGYLAAPFHSLDRSLQSAHDNAGTWDFIGSGPVRWAVQLAVTKAKEASTAAHTACRDLLKLPTHRYKVSATAVRPEYLKVDPLALRQQTGAGANDGGRKGVVARAQATVGFEVDIVVSRSRRDNHGSTRGFVSGTLHTATPVGVTVDAKVTVDEAAGGDDDSDSGSDSDSDNGSSPYTAEARLQIQGDAVGNVRVRSESVRTLDPAVNSLESRVDAIADKVKSVADEVRSWRSGVLARNSDTVRGALTSLGNLIESAETEVRGIKTRIRNLASWCVNKVTELVLEARQTYVIEPAEKAIREALIDNLVKAGPAVLGLLKREATGAMDAFSFEFDDVEFNEKFTSGRLGTEIVRRALAPLVVQATKMEETRTRHHLWRRALQRGGAQARAAARHHAALENCANRRCLMDHEEEEGVSGSAPASASAHCTGDPLTRYMALFQRVSRKSACFQGRIIPMVALGKVEISLAEPYCCDPTGRVTKGACSIAVCAQRELPKAVRSGLELTRSRVDYDKVEAAPSVWDDPVLTPIVPTSTCENGDEREGSVLWYHAGDEPGDAINSIAITGAITPPDSTVTSRPAAATATAGDSQDLLLAASSSSATTETTTPDFFGTDDVFGSINDLLVGTPARGGCPVGTKRLARSYLGHGVANLRGTRDGSARDSASADALFVCVGAGHYGHRSVRGIKLVAAAEALRLPEYDADAETAITGNEWFAIRKTTQGLDASFTPRAGCDAVYLAVQLVALNDGETLIAESARIFYHDSTDGTGLPPPPPQQQQPSSSEVATAGDELLQLQALHALTLGVEDELVQVLGRSSLGRHRLDSGNLGFGIAIDPPAPEMFPGLKLRIWLHDVNPLSYLQLRDLGFEYKDNIPYTALDDDATLGSAGSGPGFDMRLDVSLAAEASISVLGTELFTTLTIAEVLAMLAPRNGKLDPTKYPGPGDVDGSVLFATDGPAALAVGLSARCQLWHQGGSGESRGWRLRITELTLKQLEVKVKSQRAAVNVAADVLFEGLDTVGVLREMFDLRGLELAIAALDEDGGLGALLEDLKGKGAIAKGSVKVNIPESMLRHDGVLHPAYVAVRAAIRGTEGLSVSE